MTPGFPDEGYQLDIAPEGVRLVASTELGIFRARQTLEQIRLQTDDSCMVPSLHIEDAPAFPVRGVLLDISRGRVPRPERLARTIRRLAALKINHVQLYFEHPFRFAFDSAIAGEDAYTPSDLRRLDALCRSLHVELVPCFACFGHLGRLLSLPPYRPLAEVEFPAPDWASATFLQRLHGATINPDAPGTLPLLERLLGEFLPCFSSPHFNLCGDETYELGAHLGPSPASSALAALYARHVRHIAEIAARHGKTVLLWGDILHKHPEAIPHLPEDATILDWAYFPTNDFDRCHIFADAGRPFLTCPSTRGFGTLFNRVDEAALVLRRQTDAALRHGARGLLVTDWGDFGHFNLPATSLHPLALGAALAWNPDTTDAAFDDAFSVLFHPAELAREAGRFPSRLSASPFFPVHPRLAPADQTPLPPETLANDLIDRAETLAEDFAAAPLGPYLDGTERRELWLAADCLAFAGMLDNPTSTASELRSALDTIESLYAPLWHAESLPAGLADIQSRIFSPLRAKCVCDSRPGGVD